MRARIGAAIVVALVTGGCVSLTPYRTVRQMVPAERFVEVGGQAVHVEQWGRGDALVLLHGFGGSTYSWRLVGPELGRGFRVVAVDLNGFGWTERVAEREAYTLPGQARLVLGVMDALGIARAHLAGHSYCGGVGAVAGGHRP
jgi:Predicted hydrolases or acyltransferases (alpha/beta hydrolase superfamily)